MAGEPNKPCYRVRDWDRVYECAQSRKAANWSWVAVPNKHDTEGFRILASRADAVVAYCGWALLVQVASKMPTRGLLATSDGALDARALSIRTGFPVECFEAAIQMALDPEIHWLEMVDPYHAPTRRLPPPTDRTEPNRTEQDITGHNRTDSTQPESESDCAQEAEVGSDRRNDRRKFQQVFAMRILTALGIHTDTGGRQVETMFRNALRIVDLPDSERITNELVDRARSKVAAGMRSPIKAWQAEFNKLYPKPRRMTNG